MIATNLDHPPDRIAVTTGTMPACHPACDGVRCGPMADDFYCDEVLSGRTAVRVVAETTDVLAYHHTRPFWPVHIVVIPKHHVPSLTDLGDCGETLLVELLAVVRQVAAGVEREHGAARVLTNLGRYQDSKHLHFHVNSGEPLR